MRRRRGLGSWCAAAVLAAMTSAACGGSSQEARGAAATGGTGASSATAPAGRDRSAVVERMRSELARLLKKGAAELPIDTPVIELGADDLTVVEWQMAAERAFAVDIDDDTLFNAGTKTRPDLTIARMADVVVSSPSSR